MAKQWNITADSIPVLDGWGFDEYWLLSDWVKWHKQLVDKYSSQNKTVKDKLGRSYNFNPSADVRFITEWKKQTTGAAPINSISNVLSPEYEYIRKNITLYVGTGAVLYDMSVTNPSTIIKLAADTAQGVADVAVGVYKTVKMIITIAILGVAVVGGVFIYKAFKK